MDHLRAKAGLPGATRLLAVGGAVFFGWLLVHGYLNLATYIGDGSRALLLSAVPVAVGTAALLLLGRWFAGLRSGTPALAVIVALAVILRLVWISAVDTQPLSDFADMHGAALLAAAGDFSFGTNAYFSRWTYQIGFAMFEAGLIKLFGSSLMVLKVANVLLQAGTAIVLYKAGERCFGRSAGLAAALLYALYIPLIMMCSVLTNQHVSTFLYMLGMYVLVSRRLAGRWDWLWLALCVGLGHLMRPMGGFFMAGVVVYAVLFLLPPRLRNREWLSIPAKIAAVVAVYWLIQFGAGLALNTTGITPYPLANREPYWKWMVGLNPETNGGWSYADSVYAESFPIGEARDQAERELLLERLADKDQLLSLLVSKTKRMWGAADDAPMWSLPEGSDPEFRLALVRAERVQYVATALLGLLAVLLMAVRGARQEGALYLLLLLGYAALHIGIEVQTRYRFDVLPYVLLFAGAGVAGAAEWRRRKTSVSALAEPQVGNKE